VPRLLGGGATVNFLVGKIGRNPAPWSDPMSFKPERFMPGGVDLTCTRELKMMSFIAGRRICPGIAPVMLHLEYFVVNMVREFEWWEVDGEEVNLDEFHGSFTVTTTAAVAMEVRAQNENDADDTLAAARPFLHSEKAQVDLALPKLVVVLQEATHVDGARRGWVARVLAWPRDRGPSAQVQVCSSYF
jgi:hypothetical protein